MPVSEMTAFELYCTILTAFFTVYLLRFFWSLNTTPEAPLGQTKRIVFYSMMALLTLGPLYFGFRVIAP